MSVQEKLETVLVELMDENPNQSLNEEAAELVKEMPVEVTKVDGSSSQTTRTYGGGTDALVTVVQRYETKDDSDEELLEEAYDSLYPLSPQAKKLLKYESPWDSDEEYEVANRLELIRGDDGYILKARFD